MLQHALNLLELSAPAGGEAFSAMQMLPTIGAWAVLMTAAAAQSQGPFEGEPVGRPVSARLSQLSGDDPTGRGAVLVSETFTMPTSYALCS